MLTRIMDKITRRISPPHSDDRRCSGRIRTHRNLLEEKPYRQVILLFLLRFNQAGRMAAGAIRQVIHRDPGFEVAGSNRFRLMIVAAVAGVLLVIAGVTYLAGNFTPASMIEREGMQAQQRRGPGRGRVTVLALHSKKASMNIRFSMALHTCGWRFSEFKILMAGGALCFGMFPIQEEEIGMVEIAHPVSAIMALEAVGTEFRLVIQHKSCALLSLRVAINTHLQVEICQVFAVTAGAGQGLVLVIFLVSRQAESGGLGMLELLAIQLRRQPGGGRVAFVAPGIEETEMLFWLFMAFHAFRRRSDKRISLGHVGARQVPGLWHEGLQEDKAAGGLIVRSNLYLVALHARDLNMPPIQGKVGELVIESHHAVLSIVAEQTGFTMALDMLLHEPAS